MTEIKLCGLSRPEDIILANELKPEYIGFVFADVSKRCITIIHAAWLKSMLSPEIKAVGVFVDEEPETVAGLLSSGIIDAVQLHGAEDELYIKRLRKLTDGKIIKAFCINSSDDIRAAAECSADYVLLDSGAGTGTVFDWGLISRIERPYFLAGGLDAENVADAVNTLHPFAVDVSSGIETDGVKDAEKMTDFVIRVRNINREITKTGRAAAVSIAVP